MIYSDLRSLFLKEKLAGEIWAKWAKIRPETRFFAHFLKFGLLVFL